MSDSDLFQTKDNIGRVNGGSVIGHTILYDDNNSPTGKSGYSTTINYSSENGYFYLVDNIGNFPSTGNDLYSFSCGGEGNLIMNKHTYE